MLKIRPLAALRKLHLHFQKKTFERIWNHQEQNEHSKKISILLTRFPG